jgi:hypothetical protein
MASNIGGRDSVESGVRMVINAADRTRAGQTTAGALKAHEIGSIVGILPLT